MKLIVNGRQYELTADPDTPLLYVLRDDLGLNDADSASAARAP